jgi:hypothetical protein
MVQKKQYSQHKRVLIPILFYGEGQAEEIFLKHIRKLYGYGTGIVITVRRGKGGAPSEVVRNILRCPGDYDKKIVMVDNDKSVGEMEEAREIAKERGVHLIENTPCLEAFLLNILEGGNLKNRLSSDCKRKFESKYINKEQRMESRRYEKIFTKRLLDIKRKKVENLDRLISLMEGL